MTIEVVKYTKESSIGHFTKTNHLSYTMKNLTKSRTWNVKIMKPGLVSEKLILLGIASHCWMLKFGQHTKRALRSEFLTSLTWKDILVSMLKKEKKRVADVSKPAASPPRITRNALLNSLQETARQVENSVPLEVRLR